MPAYHNGHHRGARSTVERLTTTPFTGAGRPPFLSVWESGAVHKWFIVQGFHGAWHKNQTSIDTCVHQGARLEMRRVNVDDDDNGGGRRFARIIYLDDERAAEEKRMIIGYINRRAR